MRQQAHQTPDPEVPPADPAKRPPDPDDVPPPTHAPVKEPEFPHTPVKAKWDPAPRAKPLGWG